MNNLIPCLGIITLLAILFGFFTFLRYRSYREAVTFAEQGLPRPEPKTGRELLRWGIFITALGLALTLGLYLVGFSTGYDYPLHLGPWMLGGFVPLFLGLALILSHFLTQNQ